MLLEEWDFLDSLYMTLITLSTVGFGEVKPLSAAGKIFTMSLVIAGVVFYGFTVNGIFQTLVEHKFSDLMDELRMKHQIKQLNDHIVICGGGGMAITIGAELEKVGKPFVFIEKDPGALVWDYKKKWPIIAKDALHEESLQEARIESAAGLAAVLTTDADNLFVVLSARTLNKDLFIQTRINSEHTRSKMIQAGADTVVSPKRVGGLQISRTFINPEVHNLLSIVVDRANSLELEIKSHTVTTQDDYCGKTIRDADIRESGYIVVAVRYEDGTMLFAPRADIVMKTGYEIVMLGPGKPAAESEK